MKYFFSSPSTHREMLKRLGVENFLLSFAVDGKHCDRFTHCDKGYFSKVIIDSGAFSVWNKGGTIDIDKYLEFCLSKPQFWEFINLDVIPKTGSSAADIDLCCEQSFENYLYLSSKIPHIMPVYHYGDNIKWLKKYMEHTDYIGISPANDTHENVKREFLKSVFSVTGTSVKTHALGYSSAEGLTMFPFYSIDSISWKRIPLFLDGKKVVFLTSSVLQYPQERVIESFIRLEQFITELWENRGVSWK